MDGTELVGSVTEDAVSCGTACVEGTGRSGPQEQSPRWVVVVGLVRQTEELQQKSWQQLELRSARECIVDVRPAQGSTRAGAARPAQP